MKCKCRELLAAIEGRYNQYVKANAAAIDWERLYRKQLSREIDRVKNLREYLNGLRKSNAIFKQSEDETLSDIEDKLDEVFGEEETK